MPDRNQTFRRHTLGMNSRILLAFVAPLLVTALPSFAQTPVNEQPTAPVAPNVSPSPVPTPATAPSQDEAPERLTDALKRLAERVLIITVDGMRPDLMLRCDSAGGTGGGEGGNGGGSEPLGGSCAASGRYTRGRISRQR
jgi:hypothetical protein